LYYKTKLVKQPVGGLMKDRLDLKYLPSIITLFRILLSISLLFVDLFSTGFVLIYLLCGLTDAMDGFIARRLKAESLLGARLDTVADIVMFAVILYIFVPHVAFSRALVIWLLAILLVRLVSMALVYFKYHKFAMLHTVSNKMTGFLLFFVPLAIGTGMEMPAIYVVCAVASVSAIEELTIHVFSKTLDVDRKSVFSK